ncbi:sulfite exporter TauE/SafE family protein [Fibrella sp. HMF5335]|uniref:Sulfite exporter TauE/SafE family protein n=1 Tax=Fibrella rubiginis TaxID=2817060 RepID=A0A939GDV8_9BACT|nr:sulfite exporter TauE/SafE family protein [Fibrella rubiginis]MBO0935429.1 sulfite exporter TauE/SafE family protein [Fibrella rubiginis]
MNVWYVTALLTGLAGSLHCIGMCGPLAMALPVGRFPTAQRGLVRGLYHAGRLLAYSLLGAVVGTLGQGLLLADLQRPVAIGAGVWLLLWVIWAKTLPGGFHASAITGKLTASLARLLRQPTLPHMAGLGFLNGLLPCGSVYVALAGALATPSPVAGAAYMLVFGLGTLPAMIGLNVLISRLTPLTRQYLGRSLPVTTVLVALWLIVRGVGLSGNTSASHSGAIPVCHGNGVLLTAKGQ